MLPELFRLLLYKLFVRRRLSRKIEVLSLLLGINFAILLHSSYMLIMVSCLKTNANILLLII